MLLLFFFYNVKIFMVDILYTFLFLQKYIVKEIMLITADNILDSMLTQQKIFKYKTV